MDETIYEGHGRTSASPVRWAAYVAIVIAIAAIVGSNARDEARRKRVARCAANLTQIGQAILLYTNEHRNRYPDSFGTLASFVTANDPPIPLVAFSCPDSDEAPPTSVDEVAARRCDYVLLADSMRSQRPNGFGFNMYSSASAEEAVVIERPGHHPGRAHVLYADGHVELCPLSTSRCATWIETQDDAVRGSPIRWPASQPTR